MKKGKLLEAAAPDGRNAAVPNLIMPGVEEAKAKEKSIETLKRLLTDVTNGKLTKPILIDGVGSSMHVAEVEVLKDPGNPDIYLVQKYPKKTEDTKKKKRLIKKIMKKLDRTLRKEIGGVTEIALMRKDQDHLEKIAKSLKVNKPRLKNRIGCIFVEAGEEEFQI